MRRIFCIGILVIEYIISVFFLGDVKILAGNVTPVVNFMAMWILVAIGLIVAISLLSTKSLTFLFWAEDGVKTKKQYIYFLLIILVLFKIFIYILSSKFIQFMYVWPDSTAYLSDMQVALRKPIWFLGSKSPVYTIWLALNHLSIGKIIGSTGGKTYFDVMVSYSDVIPPIILQNIIGIFSALICYYIFSKVNYKLAFIVTLLLFLNPTTIALENAILRESLTLFFVLSGFALFAKAIQKRKLIYSIMSGVVFTLASLSRLEITIVYIVISLVLAMYLFFRKIKQIKTMFLFLLPLPFLLIMIYLNNDLSNKITSWSDVPIMGIKTECYFYESQKFPELIKNIQKRAIQCERERMAPCNAPAPSSHVFRGYLNSEIEKYIGNNKLETSLAKIIDQIFLDIVKNNTLSFVKSVLTNIGYFLIYNVQNTSPILYDRDNYLISENWNYYVSPKMLVMYEQDKFYHKIIILLFRVIELFTIQKLLFPFYFIGLAVILASNKNIIFINYGNKTFIMTCVLFVSCIHLLFISVMADVVARFMLPILPFIFAVEVTGVMAVYYSLKYCLFGKWKLRI